MLEKLPNKIIVIVGPTAVGKTTMAIDVAKKIGAVILSADSRQCYKELNIGVARPTLMELSEVPHFFIASHSMHEKIDAAFYEKYALSLLQNLFKTHDTVVVTGGTGLYVKALVEGLDEIPAVPQTIRAEIIKDFEEKGMGWLQQQLQDKDPLFALRGEMQNPQRMMRALEVIDATGRSIINFRSGTKARRDFEIIQVGLELPREILNERINQRVDAMMDDGLEQEARGLAKWQDLNALQTVGYKEMFSFFNGEISKAEAIALIKQNTRRYAKRQMTWFKKQQEIIWFDAAQGKTLADSILTVAG